MNPYTPAQSLSTTESGSAAWSVFAWRDHTISVSAQLIPRYFPLLGEFWVSVDGGVPMTSSQLRWQEKFDFTIVDNGREVAARFKSYGLAIGRQPIRIYVDEVLVIESSVPVKRWWFGQLLGVFIGISIVVVLGVVALCLLVLL